MTIAEQAQALADSQAAVSASEPMSAFGREQAALATFEPVGVIAPGETLPRVELLDPHGLPTTLPAVLGGHRAVLVFYRGAWCPYCNIALKAYEAELLPELEQRGIVLVAVSPEKPDGSLSMREKNNLRFTVLSDPSNQLATSAGILTAP